jgi:hypothetical protein
VKGTCRVCKGSQICEHDRRRSRCKLCKEKKLLMGQGGGAGSASLTIEVGAGAEAPGSNAFEHSLLDPVSETSIKASTSGPASASGGADNFANTFAPKEE